MDNKKEAQEKVALGQDFLENAIMSRINGQCWGTVTVRAVVENGRLKDIDMEATTTIRDLPKGNLPDIA